MTGVGISTAQRSFGRAQGVREGKKNCVRSSERNYPNVLIGTSTGPDSSIEDIVLAVPVRGQRGDMVAEVDVELAKCNNFGVFPDTSLDSVLSRASLVADRLLVVNRGATVGSQPRQPIYRPLNAVDMDEARVPAASSEG